MPAYVRECQDQCEGRYEPVASSAMSSQAHQHASGIEVRAPWHPSAGAELRAAPAPSHISGRVGPNAIIQTSAALESQGGPELQAEVFRAAGLGHFLHTLPEEMVDESEPVRLFAAVFAILDAADATGVMRDAGARTGDYIIANRIPQRAQRMLRALPKVIASRVLLSAIGKHAWTFAGSGRVICRYGTPLSLAIEKNTLAHPGCVWHCAVFEQLFRTLVSTHTRVQHQACCANGAPSCRFEIML